MAFGIFGKHPGFGDFLSVGLSPGASAQVERWLSEALPALHASLGERWEAVYDSAPAIHFWIGGRVVGGQALCGVLLASRDKVGRRFPLFAAAEAACLLPPVLDPEPALPDLIASRLAEFRPDPGAGAAGIVAHLAAGLEPFSDDAPPDHAFWATRADGDTSRLWSDVARADHLRAAASRSYWWVSGGAASALYAVEGLPLAPILGWLMSATTTRDGEGQSPAMDATDLSEAE
jgi:type VI secretion system protein ImpM